MKESIRTLEGGSYIKGELPLGCKFCRQGSKLFLLITGKCSENCYYCSLSQEKKGKEIIFANERPINSFTGLMIEVNNMNAQGAAITGGDPFLCIDLTKDYIKKMKKEFGKKFHIHLYTSGRYANEENLRQLYLAGLDEVRFHPQNNQQEKAIEKAIEFPWIVGVEIPVIPKRKKEIITFLEYLNTLERVKFCNLNELEATDANYEMLKERGFKIKPKTYSSIEGSEELALEILEVNVSYSLHYCSALTKDAVQFRNRLIRTAEIMKKPYEEIQDGMIVKAQLKIPDYLIVEELIETLIDEYEIDSEMIGIKENQIVETAWYIADVLKDVLRERFEIKDIDVVYEYPTFDKTIISKTPLKEFLIENDLNKK